VGAGIVWLARGLAQVPDTDAWLSPREAERLAAMRYGKRASEFLVSRFAAKLALARAVGVEVTDVADLACIEVARRPTGAPRALVSGEPAGVAMSSTDRADWAVTVVGTAAGSPGVDGLEVGCDLELVEPRSPGFVRDYLTDSEQALVAEAAWPVEVTANLLWSAKESALKVLQTGLRRDTRSVEVVLEEGDGRDGWYPLRVHPVEGGTFPGWWRRSGSFLLTVAANRPTPPPVSLEQPDALAGASPSHRWLEEPLRWGRSPRST